MRSPDSARLVGLRSGALRGLGPWLVVVVVTALAIAALGPLAAVASNGRITAMDS